MKKYKKYKNSKIDWIGEIPEHWNGIRMKYLFKDVSIKNKPHLELLSVTQDQGVVPRSMVENRMVMPNGNLESFKVISEGDFAISLRSFEGGLEYSQYEGIISPAYTVLKSLKNISKPYFKFLFKSKSFISELQLSVVGIREGKNISYKELQYSFLPFPPLPEQTAIANFLDEKTSKIDEAVQIKEREIELLKERRQIIIQEVVTGKKVYDETQDAWVKPEKTKDSGVEWIGAIPEDWEVRKLKYFVEVRNEKVESKDFNGIYIGMENIESQTGNYIGDSIEVEGTANLFLKNDILFGKLRPYLAKVHKCEFEGICSTEFLVFKVKNSDFFQRLLISSSFIDVVNSSTYGAKMPRANSNFILNLNVAIPNEEQQEKIVHYLESIESKIAHSISLKEQEIEKLKEYKTVLIDSAVTGKIRVLEVKKMEVLQNNL